MRAHAHPRRIAAALVVVAAGLALSACAPYVVRYSSYFEVALTDADRKLMVDTAQAALENNKSGESANWSNPETGHLGTVTPLETYDEGTARPCRDYQQTVTVKGKTGVAYHTACREPDGSWKISGTAELAGVNLRWEPPGYRVPDYDYCPPYWWYDAPYWGYPYCGLGHPYYGHRHPYFTRFGYSLYLWH